MSNSTTTDPRTASDLELPMDQTMNPTTDLPRTPARRQFFGVVGAAGAAALLAACGDDDDTDTTGGDTTTSSGGGGGDVAIAEFAASLEVLAVNTYGAGLDAATAGDLGEVPPAVAEFATTAKENHQAHLDAWNGVITGNGGEEVTTPPADLEETVNSQFAEVTDVPGLAKLALMLEQIAADTYLSVLPVLEGDDAVKLAASIQATDRQHQAILHFALGEYPVPLVFQTTENAASPS